jgi:hypothetical protein
MFKLMIIPETRAGLTAAGLHSHLRDVHGPLCMAHPEVGGQFRRYVHHYAVPQGEGPLARYPLLDRDALTIIGFDDKAALDATLASQPYRELIGPDEANFCRDAGTLLHIVEERVVSDAPGSADARAFVLRRAVDPTRDAARWRDRLQTLFADTSAGAAPRFVTNRIAHASGPIAGYDVIDEISPASIDPALDVALSAAAEGLFADSETRVLFTQPKVFVA